MTRALTCHHYDLFCYFATPYFIIIIGCRWVVSFTEYEDEEQETATSDLRQV
jgi:hypothetical protein